MLSYHYCLGHLVPSDPVALEHSSAPSASRVRKRNGPANAVVSDLHDTSHQ
jgi:hypothetical protein